MEINPQRSLNPLPARIARKRVGRSSSVAARAELSGFIGSDLLAAIESGLQALPEVRQERLEEGSRLAKDPDYPAPEELLELGRLASREFFSSGELVNATQETDLIRSDMVDSARPDPTFTEPNPSND